MIKILTVVGARPQFIKAATVSRQIHKIEGLREVLVHTGQHFDANMSKVFFEQMDIPRPDYHLGIFGGSHGDMTGRMLSAVAAEEALYDQAIIAADPEAYAKFLARLDMQPYPGDGLRKMMQTPAPWEKA